MAPPAQLRTPAKALYWETEVPNKREIKSPAKFRSSTTPMSTNRNRAGRGTGGSRGNGPDSLEELTMWNSAQEDVRSISRLLARAEECREEIVELEAEFKNREPAKPSVQELDNLSALHREQVKLCEEIVSIGKGDSNPDGGILQKLGLLKAMIAHNEASAVEAPRRGGSSRDGATRASSAMEIDGAADSPAPSPMVDKPLRKGERVGASRNSLPPKDIPKDTHAKQESVESTVPTPSVEVNTKGKITFAMGAEVAFRPKATGAEEPEWIQGVVVKIIGEGKSRRYDVQDPEPDEVTKKPGQVYRTSASSMVTIPPLGQPLADYPKGKAVLARYPDTTTFYRAEVVGMNGTMVNLKFEGEEDAQVTMEVDRRFVLDHRG